MAASQPTVGTWEAPPPRGRSGYDWQALAKDARSQPGQWIKVFDRDRLSYVSQVRAGDVAALRPESGFEVQQRNTIRPEVGPRLCTMYLRFNPPKKEGA